MSKLNEYQFRLVHRDRPLTRVEYEGGKGKYLLCTGPVKKEMLQTMHGRTRQEARLNILEAMPGVEVLDA